MIGQENFVFKNGLKKRSINLLIIKTIWNLVSLHTNLRTI